MALLLGPAWETCPSARADDKDIVRQDLLDRGADEDDFVITPVTDDFVVAAFPGVSFFGVHFKIYPYGQPEIPEGLEETNVAYVQDRQVAYFVNSDELKSYYLAELTPVPDEDAALDAGRTWLRLSAEISQDGFLTFSKPQVEFADQIVTGEMHVIAGGRGQINVRLTFDQLGMLLAVRELKKVLPGVRPICQATKLLDADPLIRRMAEQDILVMGSAAKDYLGGQKAKAKPELKKKIEQLWKRICDEGR
jgi:hypothetical protein